jgi:hypothetical protein
MEIKTISEIDIWVFPKTGRVNSKMVKSFKIQQKGRKTGNISIEIKTISTKWNG